MNSFWRWILAVLVLLPITSCKELDEEVGITNLLVIVADDHSSRALGCYGNKIVRTPNLDRLADEGVIFTNAYSNAPINCASRQSILTGKYPHATGVTLIRTPFNDGKNITIAEHLRSLGYITGVVGLTHFNNWMAPVPDHGFTHNVTNRDYRKWFQKQTMPEIPDTTPILEKINPFVDSARVWLNADILPGPFHEEYGNAAYDAMKAIEFLKSNRDTSFFLWVGFNEPQSPFSFPVEYAGKYIPSEISLPTGSQEDERFVPEIFSDLSDEDKKGIIASYYTSVEYLDHQVGKILETLKEEGLSENTLVVYLGDQGYLLGDHMRFEKQAMWDPAIQAPLIFRVGAKRRNVKKSDALVQFIDVVPTVLDLMDAPALSTVQGKSMEHLFDDRNGEGNDYVFAEFLEDNKAMVTDGKWKYIFTSGRNDLGQGYMTGYGASGVLHKLYDLDNDPGETTNLAEFSSNQIILASLQKKMLKIFIETSPIQASFSDTLTLVERLSWYCEPGDEGASRGNRLNFNQ